MFGAFIRKKVSQFIFVGNLNGQIINEDLGFFSFDIEEKFSLLSWTCNCLLKAQVIGSKGICFLIIQLPEHSTDLILFPFALKSI